jgi:phosphate/sulfate permease
MLLNLGMGALGALLGVLIAWSASPVVATAMPLIFGLLGGAGSVSLLKMDLSKPNNQMRARLIGSSLLSCCTGCLVALLLAVVAKGWLLQQAATANSYAFSSQQLANVSDGIGNLVLRKRLQLLGATPDEIRALFDKMSKRPDYKVIVDRIVPAATALVEAYEEAGNAQAPGVNESGLLQGYNLAKTFLVEKAFFDSTSDPTITEGRFRYLTGKLYRQLGTTLGSQFYWNQTDYSLDLRKAVAALANFSDVLLENKDIMIDPAVSDDVNDLIKIVAAIREPGRTREINLIAEVPPPIGLVPQ